MSPLAIFPFFVLGAREKGVAPFFPHTWMIYDANGLAVCAAEAATGALANLREACQHQARQDWPQDRAVAANTSCRLGRHNPSEAAAVGLPRNTLDLSGRKHPSYLSLRNDIQEEGWPSAMPNGNAAIGSAARSSSS